MPLETSLSGRMLKESFIDEHLVFLQLNNDQLSSQQFPVCAFVKEMGLNLTFFFIENTTLRINLSLSDCLISHSLPLLLTFNVSKCYGILNWLKMFRSLLDMREHCLLEFDFHDPYLRFGNIIIIIPDG